VARSLCPAGSVRRRCAWPTPRRNFALGRRVWSSPEILPWGAWLRARPGSGARARGRGGAAAPVDLRGMAAVARCRARGLCRITDTQARCADRRACVAASSCSRTTDLSRARNAGTSEAAVLLRAWAQMRQPLQRARSAAQQLLGRLRALSVSGGPDAYGSASQSLGTGAPRLARAHWIVSIRCACRADRPRSRARVGACSFEEPGARGRSGSAVVRSPNHTRSECAAAAGSGRSWREQRHWWERALSQRLDYRLILEPANW
jgi:hypothetical protein